MARPNASRSRGSSTRSPSAPEAIWSTMPPTAEATIGCAFRIVGDAGHYRSGEQEMSRAGPDDVVGERGHHTGHVLHAVPSGHLRDQGGVGRWGWAGLEHVGVPVDPPR